MDSYLPLFLIIFAIAMVLGPIMLLQPSQGEKKLATLRSAAAQLGLLVKLDKSTGGVNYILPWRSASEFGDEWRLVKKNYPHEAHFFEYWDFDLAPRAMTSDSREKLKVMTTSLENIAAFGSTPMGVYLSWSERLSGKDVDTALSEIQTALGNIKSLVPHKAS